MFKVSREKIWKKWFSWFLPKGRGSKSGFCTFFRWLFWWLLMDTIEQHRGPFDKINLCGSSQMLVEYGVPETRICRKSETKSNFFEVMFFILRGSYRLFWLPTLIQNIVFKKFRFLGFFIFRVWPVTGDPQLYILGTFFCDSLDNVEQPRGRFHNIDLFLGSQWPV